MDLDLANRYGNTKLDDLDGRVALDIKYGNLTASKLSRGNEKPLSTLILAYGKGSIDKAGWLDATFRYCGSFLIPESQALLLDSKYSKVQLGTISSVVGEIKYDNLRIDNIKNLVLDASYTDINIGTLSNKLVLDVANGSFNIDRVPEGFESIGLDARYTGVKLGIEGSASYKLDGKVSYGGLKFNEDHYRSIKRIVENTSTTVEGIVGEDESPSATVKVDASYGTIKLYN